MRHRLTDTYRLPTFVDTVNCVLIDKAGFDVKVLDFAE